MLTQIVRSARRRPHLGAHPAGPLYAPGDFADPSRWETAGLTPQDIAQLQQQVQALYADNEALRAELLRLHQREEASAALRAALLRGGGRLLVPLLDRAHVVRSFAKLAETTSEFAGPTDRWPARERILQDARSFLESCVRFAVRRRTFLLVFSLLASAIPIVQVWLVMQQNEIIANQTELAEVQVYDLVARSMTEGDRNARLMTGALLSRSEPEFLAGVVDEAFNPDLASVYRPEGVSAAERRLEDAAFRGHLVRAVVRGIEHRVDERSPKELWSVAQPMLRRILVDAETRVASVLRLGEGAAPSDAGVAEQVDGYLVQVGAAIRLYGRLAREVDETDAFFADVRPWLARTAEAKLAGNRFEEAQRFALETVLLELAVSPALGDPIPSAGDDPSSTLRAGLDVLRQAIGGDDVDWDRLAQEVET